MIDIPLFLWHHFAIFYTKKDQYPPNVHVLVLLSWPWESNNTGLRAECRWLRFDWFCKANRASARCAGEVCSELVCLHLDLQTKSYQGKCWINKGQPKLPMLLLLGPVIMFAPCQISMNVGMSYGSNKKLGKKPFLPKKSWQPLFLSRKMLTIPGPSTRVVSMKSQVCREWSECACIIYMVICQRAERDSVNTKQRSNPRIWF